ncbi:methyl-accepting chemotaxis protein [Clostridium felsineum]|uniref:methyl-accepting chemotaxis protein n=1 Tax=Clostridium felsineum TaxID=36839 RepID=UPI00098BFE37|nr:methyl-accepting chemotaxis protein [Clostridium felsineum]URZ00463.1 Putative sensory transducer protein YfmS [Clostridium felsineum]
MRDKDVTPEKLAEAFSIVMPYLSIFFDKELAVGITDREKYIGVFSDDNMQIKATENDSIPQGGAVYDALVSGEKIIKKVPKEVYGLYFKSYAVPIKDDSNKVKGVVVAGKNLEKSIKIYDLSKKLAEAIGQITDVIGNLTLGVQELVKLNDSTGNLVNGAIDTAKNTDDIINFVQSISKQTNLLGINAAIESARAGEVGKGFNVVAQEIRKLSNSSTESLGKIDSVLKEISKSVNSIHDDTKKTREFFEEQVAAFEQVNASIQELNSTSQILKDLAERV